MHPAPEYAKDKLSPRSEARATSKNPVSSRWVMTKSYPPYIVTGPGFGASYV